MNKLNFENKKLIIVVNDINFFFSHRLNIAIYAKQNGMDVTVSAPMHPKTKALSKLGLNYRRYDTQRGLSRLAFDIWATLQLLYLFVSKRPDVVHLVTAKPIFVGGAIARLLRIPSVAAVSGLGHAYSTANAKGGMLRTIMNFGYKTALRHPNSVAIFQNSENLLYFQTNNLVGNNVRLFKGSGTNLDQFITTMPCTDELPVVVMPCRMLKTKGVCEFVEAAKIINRTQRRANFVLAGNVDLGNPATVSEKYLNDMTVSGDVEWLGYQADIAQVLARSTMVVLPSFYNEGLPKTLIDAAAAGRAVVTTDIAGCRDAIIPNVTGLLVKPKDPVDLAEKISVLLDDPEKCWSMGSAGRELAEREYCEIQMAKNHMDIYTELLKR